MLKPNFVFFGTDEFAVGVLDELASQQLSPALIITTPDQPKGRKLVMTPPAVKVWAEENKIPYIQPEKLGKNLSISRPNPIYDLLEGTDLFVVASYGKILPDSLLGLPKHGVLNVHPSLLPKYRGPSPIQTAILEGDKTSGVTIMLIDEEVDHGPILAQEEYDISDEPYFYPELRDLFAKKGGGLLARVIPQWLSQTVKAEPQDHTKATHTKKIEKTDGLISLRDEPEITFRKIRAYTPWPGAYFFIEKNRVPIRIIVRHARLEGGKLILERVIPEGKQEMNWEDFARNLTPEDKSPAADS